MSSVEGDRRPSEDSEAVSKEDVPQEVVTTEEGLLREKETLNLLRLLHIDLMRRVDRSPSSHVLYEGSSDEFTQRNSAGVVSSGMGNCSS